MMGETGNSTLTAKVTVADFGLVRSMNGQAAGITSVADFNRNGLITIADIALVQANNGKSIALITAPPPPVVATAAAAAQVASKTTVTPTRQASLFSTMAVRPAASATSAKTKRRRDSILLSP